MQDRHCSTDLCLVKQKRERPQKWFWSVCAWELAWVTGVTVYLSNCEIEYKSSFEKLILNPVRFNVRQEKKLRIFFTNLILNLCCKTPFGFLRAVTCVKTFTFKKAEVCSLASTDVSRAGVKTATGLLFKDTSVRPSVRGLPLGRAGTERLVGAAAWKQWDRHTWESYENRGLQGCLTTLPAC